jgi:glycosyltransferase involved in cell wall biosynthesis
MILVDALYINSGGGKVLLDYLILELNKSDLEVYYLLDERIIGKHPEVKLDRITYLKGSFVKRHAFYSKNKYCFSKVLCFGNLPPNIKLKSEVFTYFQQLLYLNIPKEFSWVERLKFKLKISILKRIAKNTDYWMVQSEVVKTRLQSKFGIKSDKIKVMPFYPQFELAPENVFREENTYLYVSNATPHKNHKTLIDVFCRFYDIHQKGKLIVTVNVDYPEVLEIISDRVSKGYPIENIGYVDRLTLQLKYLSSKFLIFPSLTESFGLGLIEAIECGCMVIGADLPYTFEVCEPTLTFNPLDEQNFLSVFEQSLNVEKLKPSLARIQNDIKSIINLLR